MRISLGVLLAATCVSSLGSFYTLPVTALALPQIQRGLSIPEDELGSLFALLRFGTLFSLALAVLADRMGRTLRLEGGKLTGGDGPS